MSSERIINSKSIYDGKVLHLRVDTIGLDDGTTFEREIIQHPGAVALVPLDENGDVILVRQYRAGAGSDVLELPAGGLMSGESHEDCARRELQEEIGFFPKTLVRLGHFWVASSYSTENITIFLARGLRPSKLQGDVDERITPVRMPFSLALEQALANQIEDSKTLIGLVWAAHHLHQLPSSN